MKVFIAVTHLLGAGHLTRAAALGRVFARAGHATTLLSGGFPSPLIGTGGLELVQLPPVRSEGAEFRKLLDERGDPVSPALLDERRRRGVEALREAQPDVVITELFPFGRRMLAREFEALVATAKAMQPLPLIACSLRDILVAPEKPDRIAEAHRRLEGYDAVLVHGDPELVRLEDSWPVDDRLRRLVRYTGYVDEADAFAIEVPAGGKLGDILVSGGSSRASLPLYRAAVAAARLVYRNPWRMLVGAGIAEEDFAALGRDAPGNLRVERARPDFRALLAGAAVSVSQAGYNTCVDLLRAGTPAILVPFEAGRETEQRLRAERLAHLGFARLLPEARLSPESLADIVATELASSSTRPRPGVDLDGAARTVGLVEAMAAERRGFGAGSPHRPSVVADPVDWSALDHALRRAADRGGSIAFWWRDDDAVAATPALERLLALRARYRAPLAIAAIPALLARSLPQRLAHEPLVAALVHGLVHRNHAGRGEKKAEFGPQRPGSQRLHDAARALALSQAAFGSALRPVFVPPWNRMAPDLAALLRQVGFVAVSAFSNGPAYRPEPLLRLDTHVDPVDWRGGRGLVDATLLVARLAAAVDARVEAGTGGRDGIGLLTHHLVQDAATWRFCEALLERLALAPSAVLASVDDLMAAAKRTRRPDSPQPAIVNGRDPSYTG